MLGFLSTMQGIHRLPPALMTVARNKLTQHRPHVGIGPSSDVLCGGVLVKTLKKSEKIGVLLTAAMQSQLSRRPDQDDLDVLVLQGPLSEVAEAIDLIIQSRRPAQPCETPVGLPKRMAGTIH